MLPVPGSTVVALWWECACVEEREQRELSPVPFHFYVSYFVDHSKEVPGAIVATATEMDSPAILGRPN